VHCNASRRVLFFPHLQLNTKWHIAMQYSYGSANTHVKGIVASHSDEKPDQTCCSNGGKRNNESKGPSKYKRQETQSPHYAVYAICLDPITPLPMPQRPMSLEPKRRANPGTTLRTFTISRSSPYDDQSHRTYLLTGEQQEPSVCSQVAHNRTPVHQTQNLPFPNSVCVAPGLVGGAALK
jgi:hypothetical protein